MPELSPLTNTRNFTTRSRNCATRPTCPCQRSPSCRARCQTRLPRDRSPKHAVVCCTDSIMRLLTKDELEAVLAHELSHVKNRDILTMTMASFIAMIASMIMQSFFFSALFGGNNREMAQGGLWSGSFRSSSTR